MRWIFLQALFYSTFFYGQRSDFTTIEFKAADSIALLYKGESLKNLPVLTHKLTTDLSTPVEKFRALYTWVSTNIENDYGAYLTTRKKRKKLASNRDAYLEWNASFTPKVFARLIKDRKTACTGYAYLIREMAVLAGFDCKIVNGYGRTPTLHLDEKSTANHSWNAVEINGKWYLCDATWSAGRVILQEDGPQFQTDYFDGYFLADPVLFIKNHYPLDTGMSLLSDPPTFSEFLRGPVIYKEAFTLPVIPLYPTDMRLDLSKNDQLSFVLGVPEQFDTEQIRLVLNTGGNDRTIKPTSRLTAEKCVIDHTFEKTGLYDVHLTIYDALVATYVVRVRRQK